MISPGEIPRIPGDLDALAEHARSLSNTGSDFSTTGSDVHATWQGLAAVYEAPEAGELFAATEPVSRVSQTVGGELETAASALSTYASEVKPIQIRLESLRGQAQTFVSSVQGEDDWRGDDGKVDEHNQLMSQVNQAVAEWMAAQRRCANAITVIYNGTHYTVNNGDDQQQKGEFGFTADQLNAVANSDQGLPWGATAEEDRAWYEHLGEGVKGFFVDGVWGTLKGFGDMIGLGGGEAFKQTWSGLGNLVGIGGWDQFTDSWTAVGKSMLAWDQWDDNPARAFGQVLFNAATFVVAPAKIGKIASSGGATKMADNAAAAGNTAKASRYATVANTINRIPTVDELAGQLGRRFSAHLPNVNLPRLGLAGIGDGGAPGTPNTDRPSPAPAASNMVNDGSGGHGSSDGSGADNPDPGPADRGDGNAGTSDGADSSINGGETANDPATDGGGDDGSGPGDADSRSTGDSGPLGNQPDGSWNGENELQLDPNANAAAEQFVQRSTRNEPAITSQMQSIESDIGNGRLEGLEYRLKGEDSLKRKLATDLGDDPVSVPEALSEINDSVRYTFEVPDGNYSHGVQRAVDTLQAQGFENIKFKNTWGEGGYPGINSTWRDPATGQRFEVQFHSPDSFNAKMSTHETYEQLRLPGNSPERIEQLTKQQNEIFDSVPIPSGATELRVAPGKPPTG